MKKSKKIIIRVIHYFLKKFFSNSLYPYYLFFRTVRNFKKKTNKKKQFIKFSNNLKKINDCEFKITSQNNEDGIIEHIFKIIPNNKYFVEIGFGYYEFNSLNLIKKNWSGRLIDFSTDEVLALKSNLHFYFPKSKIDIINTKIIKDNVNEIVFLKKSNKDIDFFSIDIDGNDYWVLKNMNLSNVKVLCCEYNHWLGNEKKLAMKYNPNFNFVDNGIYGASLSAFSEMLKYKGFFLVAVESSGTNAFFVNDKYAQDFEILSQSKSFISIGRFYSDKSKAEIYKNIKESKLFIEV